MITEAETLDGVLARAVELANNGDLSGAAALYAGEAVDAVKRLDAVLSTARVSSSSPPSRRRPSSRPACETLATRRDGAHDRRPDRRARGPHRRPGLVEPVPRRPQASRTPRADGPPPRSLTHAADLRRAEADRAAARAAVGDFAVAAQGAVDASARLVDLEGALADRLRRLRAAGADEDIGAYNRIVDELNSSNDTVNGAIDALEPPFEGFGQALGRLPTARCTGKPTDPISWVDYGSSGLECARMAVPLDYDQPASGTIELTVVRRPADDPTGALPLLINPGGPGGSGIAALRTAGLELPPEILRRFDLIGLDPRGVGQSTPVDCADRLDPLFDIDLTNADRRVRLHQLDRIEAIVRQCRVRSGALLDHVDTVSAARDLDRVRRAIHVGKITFLGYSYGTYLGAVYADLFPHRVRAAVLDGAVDPAYATADVSLDDSSGFADLLDAALADCAAAPTVRCAPPATRASRTTR